MSPSAPTVCLNSEVRHTKNNITVSACTRARECARAIQTSTANKIEVDVESSLTYMNDGMGRVGPLHDVRFKCEFTMYVHGRACRVLA